MDDLSTKFWEDTVENMSWTSPVEFTAKPSKGQYACSESYCPLISTDTHCAQARNSFIFVHMQLLHEQHVNFQPFQIFFEYTAKSWSGKPLAVKQDVEDTEDFKNGAFVAD